MDSQRNMEQYFRQAMGIGQSPAPGLSDWAKMMWGPFNPAFWVTGRPTTNSNRPEHPPGAAGGAGTGSGPGGGAAPRAGSSADQILLRQMEGLRKENLRLQAELSKKQRPKRTGRKPR
jgi:hypothetical protein